MKFSIELEEFKVLYRPQITVKGQALAYFLIEFTYPEYPINSLPDLCLDLGSPRRWFQIGRASCRERVFRAV